MQTIPSHLPQATLYTVVSFPAGHCMIVPDIQAGPLVMFSMGKRLGKGLTRDKANQLVKREMDRI